MKWKIVIEIDSNKPTATKLAEAKSKAEEAVLEALNYKVLFIDTIAIPSDKPSPTQRKKCPACNGSGFYDAEESPPCLTCDGTGMVD